MTEIETVSTLKPSSGGHWWQQPFRMFQTNLREIDAGLDVEEVVDEIVEFGADTWLLSVGGIISNYPTSLDFQTANPALALRPSGDLIGDAVKAAKSRGVRVVGRMDFSKIDHRRFELHPDWVFVNEAGQNQTYNGLISTCPSGEYYQERVLDVLAEVLQRYDIAGFFFNWMSYNEVDYSRRYWGVCQCLACHRRFAEFAPGVPLPDGPDSLGYEHWRTFAHDSIEDLSARVREHLHTLRADAALILGDRADIAFHEANNAVGRPLWHSHTSDMVSLATTLRPPRPVVVNSVGFVDMLYRLAGEDPHHFKQYLVQAIARGANPSTYVMGTQADSPYACLEVAAEVTRFHRDHHSAYVNLRPHAQVILVRPDPLRITGADYGAALTEYEGLHLALTEEHIPFDVAGSAHLAGLADAAGLHRWIVLPNLGRLNEEAISALNTFRSGGGHIITTGTSAIADGGFQLANGPIDRVLASLTGEESVRSLVVTTSHSSHPWGHPMPVVGSFQVVQPTTDAHTAFPALSRAPYGPPEKCHGHFETGHPGLVVSADHGIAVLPWGLGRLYREVGIGEARRTLTAALKLVGHRPQVSGGIPEPVEVVMGRNVDGIVLHLLNRSGDRPQRFVSPLAVGPFTLRLRLSDPVTAATALRRRRALPFIRVDDDHIDINIPGLDDFEVIQITTPS